MMDGIEKHGDMLEKIVKRMRKRYFQDFYRLPGDWQSFFLATPPFEMELSEAMEMFGRWCKREDNPGQGGNMRGVLWEKVLDDKTCLLKEPEQSREQFVRTLLPREQCPSVLGRIAMESDGKGRVVDKIIANHMAVLFDASAGENIPFRQWPWASWWKLAESSGKKCFFLRMGIFCHCLVSSGLNEKWQDIMKCHFREYPHHRYYLFQAWHREINQVRKTGSIWLGLWRGLIITGTIGDEWKLYDVLAKKLEKNQEVNMSLLSELVKWQPKHPQIRSRLKDIWEGKLAMMEKQNENGNLAFESSFQVEILMKGLKNLSGEAEIPTNRTDMSSMDVLKKSVPELESGGFKEKESYVKCVGRMYEEGEGTKNSPGREVHDEKLEWILRHEKDCMIFLQAALLTIRYAHWSRQLSPQKLWNILMEREKEGTEWTARLIPVIRRGLLIREFEWRFEGNVIPEAGRQKKSCDNVTWLRQLRGLGHVFAESSTCLSGDLLAGEPQKPHRGGIWQDIWKIVRQGTPMCRLAMPQKKEGPGIKERQPSWIQPEIPGKMPCHTGTMHRIALKQGSVSQAPAR